MERAASLGHSITESMFVRMCVPERMCLLKWDVMLSSASSRYSVRTCDLGKQQRIRVSGLGLPVSVHVCMLAHARKRPCVWPPRQMHREWKEDRPFKQD